LGEDFFLKLLNCDREADVKLLAKKWFLIKVLGGQIGLDAIVAVSKQYFSTSWAPVLVKTRALAFQTGFYRKQKEKSGLPTNHFCNKC
jgi:hypothetical protein